MWLLLWHYLIPNTPSCSHHINANECFMKSDPLLPSCLVVGFYISNPMCDQFLWAKFDTLVSEIEKYVTEISVRNSFATFDDQKYRIS